MEGEEGSYLRGHNDRLQTVKLIYSSVHIDRIYQFEHYVLKTEFWTERSSIAL